MQLKIIGIRETDWDSIEFKVKAAKDLDDEDEVAKIFMVTYGKSIVDSGEWKKLLKDELEKMEQTEKNKNSTEFKTFKDKYLDAELHVVADKPQIKLKQKGGE